MEILFGIDMVSFIKAAGYLGLFAIVFSESGLLIGMFLPGDSLLFTSGVLASQGYLSYGFLAGLVSLAAILGDSAGYYIGRKTGPLLFVREDSIFFHKDHLEKARIFYERFGGRALIFARFMPIVRTFAPILAGIGNMDYPKFFLYNVIGALLWGAGLVSLGYGLGSVIPDIDRYLLPIIAVIIFLSFLPTVIHVIRDKERRNAVKDTVRKILARNSRII
jgi:membrane-associated protein